jgi:hypothetical protein
MWRCHEPSLPVPEQNGQLLRLMVRESQIGPPVAIETPTATSFGL